MPSVAQIDHVFEKLVRSLRAHAAGADSSGGQTPWFRPQGWTGNPLDPSSMRNPFSRDKANADLVTAISDASKPGTTGDVVACSTMIAFLAVQERAFRVRHTLRRPRAAAHTAGRRRGHGDELGPYTQLALEYVRAVLAQAKKPE